MGERGPAPLPSALKRAVDTRSDRINDAEPQPLVLDAPPEPPAHLDEVARATWSTLAPDLHRARVLTAWDLQVFARFCELESVIHRQLKLLDDYGEVIAGRRSERFVVSPVFRVYRDAVEVQRKIAREFGLTPSGRSTIRIEGRLEVTAVQKKLA
jgi:P27 family predicted phage terminase small subunit